MYKVTTPFDPEWPDKNVKVLLAKEWCHQTFGSRRCPITLKYRWMTRYTWTGNRYIIYFFFEKEEHATWFKLQWA
jgi:hypothetical protein